MKILDVNNMLDAAHDSQMEDVEIFTAALEVAAQALAQALAEHLGIETGTENSPKATYQQGFGGLCAFFGSANEGQPCPDVIDQGDPGGDWE